MVAGGSQYLPTNEPLPGYFKTVEELCYPSHNNTDNMHLENAIDRLYGRKMPEYNVENIIEKMFKRKLLYPPFEEEKPGTDIYRDEIATFAFEPSEIKDIEDMGCKPSPTCVTSDQGHDDRPD
jgi:hypothetical protein